MNKSGKRTWGSFNRRMSQNPRSADPTRWKRLIHSKNPGGEIRSSCVPKGGSSALCWWDGDALLCIVQQRERMLTLV